MGSNIKIEEFASFLNKLSNISWRDSASLIDENVSSLDQDTFKEIFYNSKTYHMLIDNSGVRGWLEERLVDSVVLAFKGEGDNILKQSDVDIIRQKILFKGFYSDISVLNDLAKNESGDLQLMAAMNCSVDTLRGLVKTKCPKVRKVVFQRLGAVECLDLMLSDKKADIREEGLRLAPVGYKKLNDMTKEIARGPFSYLIEKISAEYLPMLLANRNLNNTWVSKKLNRRLNNEEHNEQ